MISRVADHCFWFGRYIERAESTARLLSVTQKLALDGELGPRRCWPPVIVVSGELEHFHALHINTKPDESASPESIRLGPDENGEIVQRYIAFEHSNMTSLRRSIGAARDNARSIREVLSLEAWETVNGLHLWIQTDAVLSEFEHARDGFYRKIRQDTQLCLGLLRSTMLHDAPLDFIWLGVLLERVGQTARILDVHHHAFVERGAAPGADTGLWLTLLHAVSGFEAFVRSRQGRVSGDLVARFLLLEPRFPRSIRYCIQSARDRMAALRPPDEPDLPGRDTYARLRALEEWSATLEPSLAGGESSVHAILTHVVDEVGLVCSDLGRELLGYGGHHEA
jgi:uncharacterized alpha-E superfamily protein